MGNLKGGNIKGRRIAKYLPRNYCSGQNPLPLKSEYSYYRKVIYLKNQKSFMFRFLHEEDRRNLISLFQSAPDEDFLFCKHDLKDLNLLNHWLDHINSPRLLLLGAVDLDDNQLFAAATLLRGKHTANHIGEIKLFIAKPFRNLGLGSIMLEELILLANQEKLHWLKAEVVTDQKQMVKALRNKGFQIRAILEDFFMNKDKVTHDLVLMMRAVNEKADEF